MLDLLVAQVVLDHPGIVPVVQELEPAAVGGMCGWTENPTPAFSLAQAKIFGTPEAGSGPFLLGQVLPWPTTFRHYKPNSTTPPNLRRDIFRSRRRTG